MAQTRNKAYLNKEQAMVLIDQAVKKHNGKSMSNCKHKTKDLGAVELEGSADAFASLLLSSDSESSQE